MLIEKILHLRSLSMPITQIAEQCGMTVGQVKYTLSKVKQAARQAEATKPGSIKPKSVPQANEEELHAGTSNDAMYDSGKKEREWQLPSFYARDLVKLMVQSPEVLFVYWEITWPRMRMVASYLQSDYHTIQKGIRLYDVTDRYFDGANAHSHRDIYLQEQASSWYIRGVQPGRTYIADFGLFHEDRFCPILRSEPVATPRNQQASWGDPLIEPATDVRYPQWFENFSSYTVYSK